MSGGSVATAGRIMIVEDDVVAARFTMRVLERRGGFEVCHAVDPAAALELARDRAWDLVLTDVEMPGMSGIELLEQIRKIAPDLPVAVVTAHPSLDRAVQALRNRADEFMEKPIKPDALICLATALVAKGRAARAARHRSVLAIGAHPDDVEIGAAGTLLAHSSMGDMLTILTLCRGGRGGSRAAGAGEAQQAAGILGAALVMDDLSDTQISEGDPTIKVIREVVDQVEPTVIYTHSLHDVHQDHRNTHRAAMVAGHEVGRVYCFQSPSATVDFRPTRFVPIDDHLDRKLAAIDAFSSQLEIRGYLEPDLIASTARYWSRFGEGRYAEAFEVVRESAGIGANPADGAAFVPPDGTLPSVRQAPAMAPGQVGRAAAGGSRAIS